MARNYYTLVAGLREYTLDSDRKGFDAVEIIADIREQLSSADRGYLGLFYTYYDIENIINLKAGRDKFSVLGNFSREELEELIKNPEEPVNETQRLPDYLVKVLLAYADPENPEYDDTDRSRTFEKALFTAFYAECARSRNKFIKEWYEFDRNLRNLLAAFAAKRAGLPVADELVGKGYVADLLSKSSAADFGLRGELDYIDDVIVAVSDEENLLEKERKLDMVRWNRSDELTEFDYFNMNLILAYLVKINIIHRWVSLDPEAGRRMFEMLAASFGDTDKFREEHVV